MERFSLPNTVCVGVKYSLLHHAKDDVTITSQKDGIYYKKLGGAVHTKRHAVNTSQMMTSPFHHT